MAEIRLNRGIERLIHVVRNGTESSTKAANLLVWIEWIGIEGIARSECPGKARGDSPGILRVQIEIEEIERLIGRGREGLGCGRSYPIDELRQSCVRHRRHRALTEVIIIEAKDSGVGAKPQLVGPVAPCKIVIDKEPGGTPPLHP